jgi:hypothetical protein
LLSIAEYRLTLSGNDIPGLLLKLEYLIAYLQINELLSLSDRLNQAVDEFQQSSINAPFFRKEIHNIKATIETVKIVVNVLDKNDQLLNEESKKAGFKHQQISVKRFLEAYENHRLFDGSTKPAVLSKSCSDEIVRK